MVIEIEEIDIPIAKLLKRLGLADMEFEGIISSVSFDFSGEEEYGTLVVNCENDSQPDSIDIICDALKAYFHCDLKVVTKQSDLSPAKETVLRWRKILEILNGSFSYVTDAVYVQAISENMVCCHVPNAFILNKMKRNHSKLTEAIEQVILKKVEVIFALEDTQNISESDPYKPETKMLDMQEYQSLISPTSLPSPFQKKFEKEPPKTEFSDNPTPIYQMVFNRSVFTIEGEVFSLEYRENSSVATLGLYDGTDSVKCIAFRDSAKWLNEHSKNGMRIKAVGKATLDTRTQKPSFFIDQAKLAEKKEEIVDDASEKRIELHAHTQMSAMDSILKIDDYIETAAKWGWEAVAVTDHGVVQAFPDLYEKCVKKGIKPVFGMEGYLVDVTPIVYNKELIDSETFNQHDMGKHEYVVFDLETTGLSPLNDQIIEFGAVKIKEGQVIDTFSTLVNPQRPISSIITEITGITNEMLKDKSTIEEILPKFLRFLEGSILVAHNANFDYRFLKQQVKVVLNQDLNRAYVDTLSLSRSLLSIKSNSLDKVVKALNLEEFNHHRALDDADITAKVFLSLMEIAEKRGKKTLCDLDSLKSEMDLKKLFGKDITIYVLNVKGLFNLYRLVTESHIKYFGKGVPLIPKDVLSQNREGLLIGTGSPMSELASAYRYGYDESELKEIAQFYDFIEIMPPDAYTEVEEGLNYDKMLHMYQIFYQLGVHMGLDCIMNGNVHYLKDENKKPWSIMKISEKALRRRNKKFSPDLFQGVHLQMRTTQQMLEVAQKITGSIEKAKEIVIVNPKRLVEKMEDIKPITRKLHTPEMDGADENIREIAYQRVHEIYGENPPEEVKKRLDFELDAIIGNGYSVLYLIAQKIVKRSMEDGYLVGSRGSVGSSLVATMLGITEVNPLAPHYVCPSCKKTEFANFKGCSSGYDLPDKNCPLCNTKMVKFGQEIPFETFMGFNGNKVPDIDLNFSGEYQTKAHKYIEELFGSDHVFKAGTISTVADKTAYGYVLRYEEATEQSIKDIEKERIAQEIAGVKRTTGQHPGGLMIVPKSKQVFEFTPVQHPANDRNSDVQTTHFDYHSIHDDLVKIDALGHDDPTFMRYLENITGINPLDVPMDDHETIEIFSSLRPLGLKKGDIPGVENGSLGIPEFGTTFVRSMLLETRPKTFADLVRISGLSHGTGVWIDNARNLINDKVAKLSEVIACRDDIMNMLIHSGIEHVRAFQIMETVRKGKTLKEEDVEIMKRHGIKDWFMKSCESIKYLFPKAHAVAYVSMAFRVAYFKVHYPLAFYSTYFTVKGGEFDINLILSGPEQIKNWLKDPESHTDVSKQKLTASRVVNELALEMLLRGFKFLPVNIKKSSINQFDIEDNKLRIPLSRVNGLGERVAQSIVSEREKSDFVSVDDFGRRTLVSVSTVDTLREMTAFEGLQEHAQYSLF